MKFTSSIFLSFSFSFYQQRWELYEGKIHIVEENQPVKLFPWFRWEWEGLWTHLYLIHSWFRCSRSLELGFGCALLHVLKLEELITSSSKKGLKYYIFILAILNDDLSLSLLSYRAKRYLYSQKSAGIGLEKATLVSMWLLLFELSNKKGQNCARNLHYSAPKWWPFSQPFKGIELKALGPREVLRLVQGKLLWFVCDFYFLLLEDLKKNHPVIVRQKAMLKTTIFKCFCLAYLG